MKQHILHALQGATYIFSNIERTVTAVHHFTYREMALLNVTWMLLAWAAPVWGSLESTAPLTGLQI